jgi:hypothetical protein
MGAGAAGLVALSGAARGQEPANKFRYKSMLDKTHIDCLDACTACAAVCNEASHHCLSQVSRGGSDKEQHSRNHHLTMDCAAICGLSAALVARMSPLMVEQCTACADACRRCGEECSRDTDAAEIMTECARLCRECERSCREMISTHGTRSGRASTR